MELNFECDCGGHVADAAEKRGRSSSVCVSCDDCGVEYAVTITPLDPVLQ